MGTTPVEDIVEFKGLLTQRLSQPYHPCTRGPSYFSFVLFLRLSGIMCIPTPSSTSVSPESRPGHLPSENPRTHPVRPYSYRKLSPVVVYVRPRPPVEVESVSVPEKGKFPGGVYFCK